jgi:hypothetical protein
MITTKKFTDIYNKIIHDIESLKSFYFNRYILELEFGTLNFILGELIVSILNLYNVIIVIKKENSSRTILVKNINELRIIVNKLVLLIVISFNENDEKNDNNDNFICNNEEYNLNFFNPNKENYNTIKIISTKFKIITQNIEDIKKNNKIVIDNIKINILFNKIKNSLDVINELYLQIPTLPSTAPPTPTAPTTAPPTAPPTPTTPTPTAPPPTLIDPLFAPTLIDPLFGPTAPSSKAPVITFKQFCSLNNKNKIKIIIKMIVNIFKNINYKEVSFYNMTLFGFLFFLCFY